MKMYTIIGGVNGVGKSSLTGALKGTTNNLGTIVDVDKITAQLGGDTLAGGKAAVRLLDDCMEKGVSFTQETTLSGRRTVATAKKARELGYYIRLYYVGLDSSEESLVRIETECGRVGMTSPARTFCVVSPSGSRRWRRCCPTVMRRSSTTTRMAL